MAAAALAADQASKSWAVRELADGPVEVFWTLRFNLAFNSGGAFSVGRGRAWVFAVAASIVLVLLIAMGRRLRTPLPAVALGFLVGGAMGNLADRFFRDHDGAVVDFIDLQWWPVFNVADICIAIGVGLLLLTTARERV